MTRADPTSLIGLSGAPLVALPVDDALAGRGLVHEEAKVFLQCAGRTRLHLPGRSVDLAPEDWLVLPRLCRHREEVLTRGPYASLVLVLRHRPPRLVRTRPTTSEPRPERFWELPDPAWRESLIRLADELVHASAADHPPAYREGLGCVLRGALAACAPVFAPLDRRFPDLVARALAVIAEEFADPDLRLQVLADRLGCSPEHLARRFSAERRESIGEHLLETRISLARRLLRETDLPVAAVAGACGFRSQSYFAQRFRETVGVTPTTWRRGR